MKTSIHLNSPSLISWEFKDGNIDFDNKRIIAIVGTRNMSHYGRDFCNQLIENLAVYDPIIVSGLAYGVDICAHKAAIKNHLQTIAVLAHGFSRVYPKAHKKYIHQLHKKGGCITEFWYEDTPQREHFLKRNRIVAGLSAATIIIESAHKGGALVTADIANSYNRDVFAVPGKVNDLTSIGCNELIRRHNACLLQSPKNIVEMLNWDIKETPNKKIQKPLFAKLNEKEQKVYDFLIKNKAQVLDTIAIECAIPIYQSASVLLELELKGVVKSLPGKMFELS